MGKPIAQGLALSVKSLDKSLDKSWYVQIRGAGAGGSIQQGEETGGIAAEEPQSCYI